MDLLANIIIDLLAIIIIGIPILLTIMNLFYLAKPYVKWNKKKRRLNESDESQSDISLQVMQEDTNLKRNQRKTPPLIMVLAMAVLYPEIVSCLIFMIHVMPGFGAKVDVGLFWLILPFNLIVIACTLIRDKICEYKDWQDKEQIVVGNAWYDRILSKSRNWPILALILALPLLGIILGISVLLGQKPDALVKAWTETADWNLSTKVPPPDIPYEGHYLCTVAAGGHKKVVKPIRMGERLGHRVVVNRQLEIANAFELVLEEKTPGLHKAVRGFYDRFGLPIANRIRTKGACDVVYVLMKPLEWVFLIVIYLTQSHPEDLIAIQYMPGYRKFWQEFKKEKGI